MTITALSIPAAHPAFAGHFPGQPVLPGVVLLDATLGVLESTGLGTQNRWEIGNAKFQSGVRPGEALTLHHERLADGRVRFSIRTADRSVASGVLIPSQPRAEAHGEQS